MTLLETLNTTDRFAKANGMQLTEIREGFARAEMTVGENHLNGGGVCQGGAIYTLADLAFAAVSNSHGLLTLGINNSLCIMQSAQLGDRLIAEATEVRNHPKLPYCDMRVYNQRGELIATMTGLAYRKKNEFPYDSLM